MCEHPYMDRIPTGHERASRFTTTGQRESEALLLHRGACRSKRVSRFEFVTERFRWHRTDPLGALHVVGLCFAIACVVFRGRRFFDTGRAVRLHSDPTKGALDAPIDAPAFAAAGAHRSGQEGGGGRALRIHARSVGGAELLSVPFREEMRSQKAHVRANHSHSNDQEPDNNTEQLGEQPEQVPEPEQVPDGALNGHRV